MFRICLLLALAATLQSIVRAMNCGQTCTFHFCKADGLRTVSEKVGNARLLRDPDVASHPFVCRKIVEAPGSKLNVSVRVNDVGEAMVHKLPMRGEDMMPFVPISKYSPKGLKPMFPKNYFTLREITRPPIPEEKGISRKMSMGNQEKFVSKLCVKIPITSYDLLNKDLTVDKTVSTSQPEDCVSFRTVKPEILIELTWNSSDDLALSAMEPSGAILDFKNTQSETGGAHLPKTPMEHMCGIDPDGRRQIRWVASIQQSKGKDMTIVPDSGKYTAMVKHKINCGDGPTAWTLVLVIGGKQKMLKTGISNMDKNKLITEIEFTYKM